MLLQKGTGLQKGVVGWELGPHGGMAGVHGCTASI
jgi:hypothetical protein